MRAYPLSAADVSATVREALVTYLPAQLADSPRPLPAPTTYDMVPTPEAIRRVHGATLAVMVSGLTGDAERRADDTYDLTWSVGVLVWHQHRDTMPLLTAAPDYAAAVRQVFIDRTPALAESIEFVTESFDLVGDGLSDQVLGMATVEFTVRTGSTLLYTPAGPDTSGPVVLSTHVIHNP